MDADLDAPFSDEARIHKGRRPVRIAVIGVRGMPAVSGGIESHCEALYPKLVSAHPDLTVHILARRRYLTAPRLNIDGVDVIGLASPPYQALETVVGSGWSLLYALVAMRIDIIHLHGIGPAIFAALARAFGKRVVVTHHAVDYDRPKWGLTARIFLRLGERVAAHCAHRVICVSDALRSEFLARYPVARDRTVTITHGVRSLPMPVQADALLHEMGLERGRYILTVGRLDATKRYTDVIAAHRRAGPAVLPLAIAGGSIGDRDYEEALRLAAGPDVHFLGHRFGDELAALYGGAALFVHASAMEGFGLVILEALAAGRQILASDIPVHREFGLPANAYFAVGDVDTLSGHLARAVPGSTPHPESLKIAGRYRQDLEVEAYSSLFHALVPAQGRSLGRRRAR